MLSLLQDFQTRKIPEGIVPWNSQRLSTQQCSSPSFFVQIVQIVSPWLVRWKLSPKKFLSKTGNSCLNARQLATSFCFFTIYCVGVWIPHNMSKSLPSAQLCVIHDSCVKHRRTRRDQGYKACNILFIWQVARGKLFQTLTWSHWNVCIKRKEKQFPNQT